MAYTYNLEIPFSNARATTTIIMGEFKIADKADITLVVVDNGNSLKIHVSSNVLIASGGYLEGLLSPNCEEGKAFEAHRASGASEPFELELEDASPMGAMLYCAALHKRYDLITSHNRYMNLPAFAQTAHTFGALDKVKEGAKRAIEHIAGDDIPGVSEDLLNAAYLFDHNECFAELTDHLIKYEHEDVLEVLEDLTVGIAPSQSNFHESIMAGRQKFGVLFRHTVKALTNDLSQCLRPHHHEHEHANSLVTCNRHHLAVVKCYKALMDADVWRQSIAGSVQVSWAVETVNDLRLDDSYKRDEGSYDLADKLMAEFESSILKLKNLVRTTSAGVCLICFKNGGSVESCDHERSAAKCPDDYEELNNAQE